MRIRRLLYPMTQESTNCTANMWSDQPLYSSPCTQTPTHTHTHTHSTDYLSSLTLNLTNQSVFENVPFASPLSSKRTPEWGKSLSKHCNKEDHICPAPVWMGEDDPLKSSWQRGSIYTVWPAALLTLESSFCFTYAPLAAVRTLFSIMNTYPSRSKAKSALQSKKRHGTWQRITHVPLHKARSGWQCLCMWPSHLAAMKAPKIMVNTVILMEVEKVFLWGK